MVSNDVQMPVIKGLPKDAKIQKVGTKRYAYYVYVFTINGKRFQERDYIGVLSEDGSEFIPNKTFKLQGCYQKKDRPLENWKNEQRRLALTKEAQSSSSTVKPQDTEDRQTDFAIGESVSVGATALAIAVLEKTQMIADAASVLVNSDDLADVLNLAAHAAITSDPTYCAERESKVQKFIGKGCPSSPRASELLQRLGAQSDLAVKLARERAKHVKHGALLAIDGTEIPSASKNINLTALGKTKDGTFGTQINVSLLVDTQSGDAICYRAYAGNTHDISTLDDNRALWDSIGLKNKHVTFAADRAYWSKEQAAEMDAAGYKFLFGAKTSFGFVKEIIENRNHELFEPRNWITKESCYGIKKNVSLRTDKGEITLFTYVFRSTRKQEEEMDELSDKLESFERKWVKASAADRRKLRDDSCYAFFKETAGFLCKDEDAFNEACYLKGFFALSGNLDLTTRQAIETYRERNTVEIDFKLLLKNLLQSSRVHSTQAFDGLMFITFIGLSILTYLNRAMEGTIPNSASDKGFSYIKDLYTTRELFKDLQRIQLRRYGKDEYRLVNVLKRDHELAKALGLEGLYADPERVANLLSMNVCEKQS